MRAFAERTKLVADYVYDHDGDWMNWLQTNRVELRVMTTPQLLDWLGSGAGRADRAQGPQLDHRAHPARGADRRFTAAIAAIRTPDGAKLARDIKKLFKREPDRGWRDHIEDVASLKGVTK